MACANLYCPTQSDTCEVPGGQRAQLGLPQSALYVRRGMDQATFERLYNEHHNALAFEATFDHDLCNFQQLFPFLHLTQNAFPRNSEAHHLFHLALCIDNRLGVIFDEQMQARPAPARPAAGPPAQPGSAPSPARSPRSPPRSASRDRDRRRPTEGRSGVREDRDRDDRDRRRRDERDRDRDRDRRY